MTGQANRSKGQSAKFLASHEIKKLFGGENEAERGAATAKAFLREEEVGCMRELRWID